MTATDPTVSALHELGVSAGAFGRVLDTARSPAAVEVIGGALADALRPHRPRMLLAWDSSDSAVILHVVARFLGVGLARAVNDMGALFVDPPGVSEIGDVALIGTAWDEAGPLSALRRLATGRGGRVVAVGAVLRTAVLDEVTDVPTVSLVPAPQDASL